MNLQQYEDFLNTIQNHTENIIKHSNPFYPVLLHEIHQTFDILYTIKPNKNNRAKRAFNFIGTAWKYLAGSPDHDDFELFSSKINEQSENNNKQIIINQSLMDRMNNLTKLTNELSNLIKTDNEILDETANIIQNKVRILKEELINIKYAIQWAKHGIINSLLLNQN